MSSNEKRPSPSDSATLFKTGSKKKGNDGNMWMVKENKNGVKRWTKVSKKTESKGKSESKKTLKVKKPNEDRIKFTEASFLLKVIKPTQIKKYLKDPIFDNLYKNIIPKIKKLKIEFYIVPLPLSYDMEILLFQCKIEHGKRVLGKPDNEKRILNQQDINNGLKKFIDLRKSNEPKNYLNHLYI